MSNLREFIYLDDFPGRLRSFEPTRYTLRPCAVMAARHVENARALLDGGTAILQPPGGETAQLVLAFPETGVGRPRLDIACAGCGHLRLRYGENSTEVFRDALYAAPWMELPEDRFPIVQGQTQLRPRYRRAFRYLRIECQSDGPVTLKGVVFEAAHHPVTERGRFACSDDVLNKAYAISRHTTKLCMQRFYEDGVKRDGLLWTGDFRVQQLCAFQPFMDHALAEKSLYIIAACQRRDGSVPACAAVGGGHQHPDTIEYMTGIPWQQLYDMDSATYYADVLCAVRDFHLLWGDTSVLDALWPFSARLVRFMAETLTPDTVDRKYFGTDNQFDAPMDWWSSPATKRMQLIDGFQAAAELAAVTGDTETCVLARQRAAYWADQLRRRFYSEPLGCFTDGPVDLPAERPVSLHAAAFAVLTHLVEPGKAGAFLRRTLAIDGIRRPAAGHMEFHVLRGLLAAGLASDALDAMRAYWGTMLAAGSDTCWERLYPEGVEREGLDYPISRCHGWSAGPCWLLPSSVLGARPTRPGWEAAVLRPQLGELDWAEGCVPTPRGDIHLRWEARGRSVAGRVELPEGVDATVQLNTDDAPITLRPGLNLLGD